MPRDIPRGNGALLVAFDCEYRTRDPNFPHVGLEHHTANESCSLNFIVSSSRHATRE
jgi:hypothetical protein